LSLAYKGFFSFPAKSDILDRQVSSSSLFTPDARFQSFLGDRLQNGSSYDMGQLSVLSVCPVCDVGVLWRNGWMDEDATWYGGRPQPRPYCVRWTLSSPKKEAQPPISAHVCCGQTAGWIKMPPGTDVGIGPGDIVSDGDPAPHPQKRSTAAPLGGPELLLLLNIFLRRPSFLRKCPCS